MATEFNLDFSNLSDAELVDMLRADKTGGSLLEEAAARILEYLSPLLIQDIEWPTEVGIDNVIKAFKKK